MSAIHEELTNYQPTINSFFDEDKHRGRRGFDRPPNCFDSCRKLGAHHHIFPSVVCNKMCYKSGDLGPVHTMPDKFENATLLLRIRLPSTLIRIKRSTKTELFENALQSGTI